MEPDNLCTVAVFLAFGMLVKAVVSLEPLGCLMIRTSFLGLPAMFDTAQVLPLIVVFGVSARIINATISAPGIFG